MVWIAGPLSGLIMQPLVGVLADHSRSRFGRRRPFMIGGSIIVVICLLILGWTRELVDLLDGDAASRPRWTIVVAIASIYAIDFAINAVQSSCRSLIVDTLPIEKQQLGSAWAARMVAVGHLVGYAAGTMDLVGTFGPTFGDTQFKQLTLLAAVALVGAVGVTSWAVHERVLISVKEGDAVSGALAVVMKIWQTTLHLPPRIQGICWVQFWAWIGEQHRNWQRSPQLTRFFSAWFPFLFYGPTWVGETYFRYSITPAEAAAPSTDRLGDIGRIGSLSLVIFSLVALAGSLFLPILVRSPAGARSKFTPRPPPLLASFLTTFHALRPDLSTAWLFSHLLFAASMALTPFVRSVAFATTLISTAGLPWALASWAPFAFMGVEINRLAQPTTILANGTAFRRIGNPNGTADHDDIDEGDFDDDDDPLATPMLHLHHLSREPDDDVIHNHHAAAHASTGETAGIYLGILNLFTTLPQFVGTFISMLVFAIVEPGVRKELVAGGTADAATATVTAASGEPTAAVVAAIAEAGSTSAGAGVNAISICLFIGALSSCGAAYATWRLKFVR